MAKTINSIGSGSKFVTAALMGMGGTSQDKNGRWFVDGQMVDVELSRVIAETIYIGRIFRNGQSVDGKYTTDTSKGGATRVLLDTPLPFSSRTMSYGGRAGTPGNGGVINMNGDIMPGEDEILIYRNQVNDQILFFPDIKREYMPLDLVSRRLAGYAERVQMDRDGSTLAEILAYNIWRSINGANNLIDEGDLTQRNAYASLMSKLNGLLDEGDPVRGIFAYKKYGRFIIGRPTFIYNIFNLNSGLVVLGGDRAQEMLKNYNLDARMADRDYVGTNYVGESSQFAFITAPSETWRLAEKYLGLPVGAFDNIDAICGSFDATAAVDSVDLGVKLVDSSGKRGIEAQPLNVWGHEAFRKVYLIGNSTLTNDYLTSTLGFTAENRAFPVAPAIANPGNVQGADTIGKPVYGADGTVTGYLVEVNVPRPNGDNMQSGLKQVAAPTATPAPGSYTGTQSVTLASETTGADIYYTTDGTTPTISGGTKYSAAISVTATQTIKAIAVKSGMIPSPVQEFAYTITAGD